MPLSAARHTLQHYDTSNANAQEKSQSFEAVVHYSLSPPSPPICLSAPKRAKVKLAAGWQKRVMHVHSDVEAQASLMSRRGVKHKEVGGVFNAQPLVSSKVTSFRHLSKSNR